MRNFYMTRSLFRCLIASLLLIAAGLAVSAQVKPGRDPNQPIDEDYTKKIREYTTESFLN